MAFKANADMSGLSRISIVLNDLLLLLLLLILLLLLTIHPRRKVLPYGEPRDYVEMHSSPNRRNVLYIAIVKTAQMYFDFDVLDLVELLHEESLCRIDSYFTRAQNMKKNSYFILSRIVKRSNNVVKCYIFYFAILYIFFCFKIFDFIDTYIYAHTRC